MTRSLDECTARYGEVDLESRTWARESEWCSMFQIPSEAMAHPDYHWVSSISGHFISQIYCNKDMHGALCTALTLLAERGFLHELNTLDGCLNIRSVRGTEDEPSTHCYALAIDVNASQNPLGGPVTFSEGFLQCWKDAGFSAGAEFERVDGMHFSAAWE